MALYLVLEDFAAGPFSASAGSLIDSATVELTTLQNAGLAVVLYDPATMSSLRTAFLGQRGSRPSVPDSAGDLCALLFAQSSSASRVIHTPGITPSSNSTIPGQGPEPIVLGTMIGMHYQRDTDVVYSYSKIQTSYISDASFHVHWTKAVDTNQAGAVVRWRLRYTVFDGSSQDVVAGPTGTVIWDDTYDDAGTTSRIVYRTPNAAATGFVAGYYVGMELGFVAANTTLSGRPVVVSCDILARQSINAGN